MQFLIMAFLLSLGIVLISTPPIVRVAMAKNIFDVSDHRKLHKKSTPTLGGISIFIAVLVTTMILSVAFPAPGSMILIAAMVMLFFTGIKDDILFIAPTTKFIVQFLVAVLLVYLGRYVITDFNGVFGIHEVPMAFAELFTVLLIVLFINAYNLIDGIDGLAGTLVILGSLFFSGWFYMNDFMLRAVFSMATVGGLVGFLYFNVYNKKYKIFMGDTGSLLVGLIMAMQVVWFLSSNLKADTLFPVKGAPVIALALVSVPLIDTLRVFTMRLLNGEPPFRPDRTHIHHRMLLLLPKHMHSSMCITALNLLTFLFAFWLVNINMSISIQFLIILGFSILISFLPDIIVSIMKRREIPVHDISGNISEDPDISRLRKEIKKHKSTLMISKKFNEEQEEDLAV